MNTIFWRLSLVVYIYLDCGDVAVGDYSIPLLTHFASWRVNASSCWKRYSFVRFSVVPISPPARWGLLDFMSVAAPSPSPSPPRRTSTTMITPECSLPDLNHDHRIHAQCSLPDLNHDHPRPVFAAGPQPRPSTPSVRCRTSTTTIHAQCSLPDLNHDHQRLVFAAGPQLLCQKLCQIECQKLCQIECQKLCQIECQKLCQIDCQKLCVMSSLSSMHEHMEQRVSEES